MELFVVGKILPKKERVKNFVCKLRSVHGSNVLLVESSYDTFHKKAKFFDKDAGFFFATPNNVAKGQRHPSLKSKRISQSRTMSVEAFKKKLRKVHGETLSLDENTYKNTKTKAKFIDKDYGEFWAYPGLIIYNKQRHRQRFLKERSFSRSYLFALSKSLKNPERQKIMREGVMKKYKTENVFSSPEIKQKIKQTNLKKYSCENPQQNKEIAIKTARSLSNSCVLHHWKTGEELVCTASYEKAVVKWLNENKVDFRWQPKIFKVANGKTYRPDLYLVKENKWVEIKGYFRKDAREKWEFFSKKYPNSQLWDKKKLKQLEIL